MLREFGADFAQRYHPGRPEPFSAVNGAGPLFEPVA
jgi:hypothetical protein